jgi:hypothetical protein
MAQTPCVAVVTLALGLLVGCSGGVADVGGTDGRDADDTTKDVTKTGTTSCGAGGASGQSDGSDPVRAAAVKKQLDALEQIVGRYVRGASPVYRGTLAAHDNQSVFGLAGNPQLYHDENIPMGEVLGGVDFDGNGASLILHSVASHKFIQLAQPADKAATTDVYMILDESSNGGRFGTCASCVPSLRTSPAAITLDNLTVSGQVEYVPQPLVINVTAALTLASPCTVTLAELATLDTKAGAMKAFTPVGGEIVQHVSDVLFTPDAGTSCGTAYPYTIDLFVDRTHTWIYGVRSYVAGTPYPMCQRAQTP